MTNPLSPRAARLHRYSPNTWGQMLKDPPDDWPVYYKAKDVEKVLAQLTTTREALRLLLASYTSLAEDANCIDQELLTLAETALKEK